MKPPLLAILGAALIGALTLFRKDDADPMTTSKDPFPLIIANVPGYRRATQAEVTPEMQAAARDALSGRLGSVLYMQGYALALETHQSPEKGRHKGVSVFVPV